MDFFSLGELFIGNGMGKSTSEINPNTFGNMAHPNGANECEKSKINADNMCWGKILDTSCIYYADFLAVIHDFLQYWKTRVQISMK